MELPTKGETQFCEVLNGTIQNKAKEFSVPGDLVATARNIFYVRQFGIRTAPRLQGVSSRRISIPASSSGNIGTGTASTSGLRTHYGTPRNWLKGSTRPR